MSKILTVIKKFKWILLIISLIAVGAIIGKKYLSNTQQLSTKQEQIFAKVEKGTITASISASGQIATANYISVTTGVNGIVKKVYVKEGDEVKSGQKLMEVTLDSEGEKSKISSYTNYLKASNSLEEAKSTLAVLDATILQKGAAFNTVKESNSYQTREDRVAYAAAESAYIEAVNSKHNKNTEIEELQLAKTSAWMDYQTQSPTITAPTDGVIASVLAIEGAKIENSVSERSIQTVAAIKKTGAPVATLNISEMDINNVLVGQKVNLTLNSLKNQKLTGRVAGIDKIGTTSNGITNYPVTVKFDNDSDFVLPNMSVDAEIIRDEKSDVLFVPTSAIRTVKGKSIVRVIKNGKPEGIEVSIGISDTNNTEIISGLREGDEVVLNTLPTSGFNTKQNQFSPGGFSTFGTGGMNRR